MTKKEMVYNIISSTTYTGLNQSEVDRKINKTDKAYIERAYQCFLQNPENANGIAMLILR